MIPGRALSLFAVLLASACGAPEPTLTLRQLGTAHEDQAIGIAVGADASLFLGANTNGVWEAGTESRGADGVLVRLDPSGVETWVRQFGSVDGDDVSALVVAPDGHAYLAGTTLGALPGAQSQGETDSFVVAYSAEGERRWTAQWGSPDNDFATALVMRGEELLVGGYDRSNPSFGAEIYVQELSQSGALGPVAHVGSDDQDFTNGLAWDPENDAAYVVGGTLGALAGEGPHGSTDVVVLRQTGQTTDWADQVGTGDIDGALAVTLAPDGGFYVLAVSYSNLGSGASENDGVPSPWLMRYSATGAREWMRRLTAVTNASRMTSIAVAPDGTVVVAGYTTEPVSGESAGKRDALVLRLNSDGEQLSATQWGSAGDDLIEAVTVTAGGQILVAGTTDGEMVAGGHLGGNDAFIARLERDGRITW